MKTMTGVTASNTASHSEEAPAGPPARLQLIQSESFLNQRGVVMLQKYLEELKKVNLLSPEEEKELWIR